MKAVHFVDKVAHVGYFSVVLITGMVLTTLGGCGLYLTIKS